MLIFLGFLVLQQGNNDDVLYGGIDNDKLAGDDVNIAGQYHCNHQDHKR